MPTTYRLAVGVGTSPQRQDKTEVVKRKRIRDLKYLDSLRY